MPMKNPLVVPARLLVKTAESMKTSRTCRAHVLRIHHANSRNWTTMDRQTPGSTINAAHACRHHCQTPSCYRKRTHTTPTFLHGYTPETKYWTKLPGSPRLLGGSNQIAKCYSTFIYGIGPPDQSEPNCMGNCQKPSPREIQEISRSSAFKTSCVQITEHNAQHNIRLTNVIAQIKQEKTSATAAIRTDNRNRNNSNNKTRQTQETNNQTRTQTDKNTNTRTKTTNTTNTTKLKQPESNTLNLRN